MDAFTSIARKESPAGLLRGLGPTVLTNAPFSALYYMFYKRLQTQLKKVVAAPAGGLVSSITPKTNPWLPGHCKLRTLHVCAAGHQNSNLHLPMR